MLRGSGSVGELYEYCCLLIEKYECISLGKSGDKNKVIKEKMTGLGFDSSSLSCSVVDLGLQVASTCSVDFQVL